MKASNFSLVLALGLWCTTAWASDQVTDNPDVSRGAAYHCTSRSGASRTIPGNQPLTGETCKIVPGSEGQLNVTNLSRPGMSGYIYLGGTTDLQMFANQDRVTTKGAVRSVWVIVSYAKQQQGPTGPFTRYTARWTFDCNGGDVMVGAGSLSVVKDDQQVITGEVGPMSRDVPPNSTGDSVVRFACGLYQIGKGVRDK